MSHLQFSSLYHVYYDDAVWISKTKHHKLDRLVSQGDFRWPWHINILCDGMMKYLLKKMVLQIGIGVQYCSIL